MREPGTVTVVFKDSEVSELFKLLEEHKSEHANLHEVVYQAMTKTLFQRIDGNG